jgi:hypothetical protein
MPRDIGPGILRADRAGVVQRPSLGDIPPFRLFAGEDERSEPMPGGPDISSLPGDRLTTLRQRKNVLRRRRPLGRVDGTVNLIGHGREQTGEAGWAR